MTSGGEDVKDVLSSASKLASYSMVLQLSFRILTFMLNAFTLHRISREALGVVNVRLLLLYSTILFLSREAFRRACLSKSPKEGNESYIVQWKKIFNILWCIVPIGFVCTLLLTYIWIHHLENPNTDEIPYYPPAAILFGCSALLELVAEPLWVLSQALLFIKLRVFSEGIAMIAKCIFTVILVVFFPSLGILSFCLAQVMFSLVYVAIYYGYFFWYVHNGKYKKSDEFPFSSTRDFFPTFTGGAIDYDTAKLTWSFFKQSFLKQLLTEGEKYMMTILNVLNFGDQGVYDVVTNLGSLAARFIFLPIEESFYIFFAKALERGVPVQNQEKETVSYVRAVLFCLLRLVVLMGTVILSFGYSYSFLLLDIYGGPILSEGSGPLLLKVYCFYVLLIAINGTTECFVFAAMTQQEVERYNKVMLLFSLLFLVSSYYLTLYLGAVGFILANCLNMLARILHSIFFIHRFFPSQKEKISPLWGILPEPAVIFTLTVSFIICFMSEKTFCCDQGLTNRLLHILFGALCLGYSLAIIYVSETQVVNFLKNQYFAHKSKAD